jgi:sugar phosphate permease
MYIGIGILISSLSYLFFPVIYVLTGFYSFPLTIIFMSINGFFQASCWPGIMGLFGNWFKNTKKGLLMAVWTMSGNFGNIFSTNICNIFENKGYSWFTNFITTGIFGVLAGLSIFIFLDEKPVEA